MNTKVVLEVRDDHSATVVVTRGSVGAVAVELIRADVLEDDALALDLWCCGCTFHGFDDEPDPSCPLCWGEGLVLIQDNPMVTRPWSVVATVAALQDAGITIDEVEEFDWGDRMQVRFADYGRWVSLRATPLFEGLDELISILDTAGIAAELGLTEVRVEIVNWESALAALMYEGVELIATTGRDPRWLTDDHNGTLRTISFEVDKRGVSFEETSNAAGTHLIDATLRSHGVPFMPMRRGVRVPNGYWHHAVDVLLMEQFNLIGSPHNRMTSVYQPQPEERS